MTATTHFAGMNARGTTGTPLTSVSDAAPTASIPKSSGTIACGRAQKNRISQL